MVCVVENCVYVVVVGVLGEIGFVIFGGYFGGGVEMYG